MSGYGLHVLDFPSGRYGYVGSIPTTLGQEVPATTSDVLGQRAHYAADGRLVTWKFPSFATAAEAFAFARDRGAAVCSAAGCACRRLEASQG